MGRNVNRGTFEQDPPLSWSILTIDQRRCHPSMQMLQFCVFLIVSDSKIVRRCGPQVTGDTPRAARIQITSPFTTAVSQTLKMGILTNASKCASASVTKEEDPRHSCIHMVAQFEHDQFYHRLCQQRCHLYLKCPLIHLVQFVIVIFLSTLQLIIRRINHLTLKVCLLIRDCSMRKVRGGFVRISIIKGIIIGTTWMRIKSSLLPLALAQLLPSLLTSLPYPSPLPPSLPLSLLPSSPIVCGRKKR